MAPRSLKYRLIGAALISITSALLLYWIGLSSTFERHVIRRVEEELDAHLLQLAAAIRVGNGSVVELSREPADPRFARPFSGLYWQINKQNEAVLRSRSLWDQELAIPPGKLGSGEKKRYEAIPFGQTELIAVERRVRVGTGNEEQDLNLVVAIDREDVTKARDAFSADVLGLVGILGLFLVFASGAQIIVGLQPFNLLRHRLNIVRSAKAARLEGQFPSEVQNLVDELNELLNARDEMIKHARARAGDLAHGLKTPLAILAAEGRKLKEEGRAEISEEIARQVELMNRHVERQLARTRARGPGEPLRAPAKLRPAIQRLVKTLKRLPQGDRLNWIVEIPADLEIDFDPMDFDEVAGNILDNARKWARTRVIVSTLKAENELRIIFEDDGPGVPKAELPNVVERGGRLDRNTPGTGLGLAIVSDVMEIYNGKLQIENAMPSGLRVSLLLPRPI
ncbi:MAG: HAMP domain-containing sensor histidine kinase [Rhodomicrobiaceae bacterium]